MSTGAVTLNSGTTAIGSIALGGVNSPLGAGTSIVFGGGLLQYAGVDAAPATDRAVTLNLAGGTVSVANPGTMLTLSESIGGNGGLGMTGPGGLALTNTANSFAGSVSARVHAGQRTVRPAWRDATRSERRQCGQAIRGIRHPGKWASTYRTHRRARMPDDPRQGGG